MKKNNRFQVWVKGARGNFRAGFTIDQQSFFVCERPTKKEAHWYARCLRHAFRKLKFKDFENVSI